MSQLSRSVQWAVWGMLGLTVTVILGAFVLQRTRSAQGGTSLPLLFPVSDFALTNQNGELVTRSSLRGQVWLADVIFTRCPGPCPEMTRRMANLQDAVSPAQPVRFVSVTTDPTNDTPAVLRNYARRFGVQEARWHFLTGTRRQVVDLAVGGLKLTALDKEAAQQTDPNDLFIHSLMFVLVDKHGNARAVFESDDPEMQPRVLQAVDRLLAER